MAVDVNAGTKVLTHEDNQDEESDEFDPWICQNSRTLGQSGLVSCLSTSLLFSAQRGRFLSIFIWFNGFPALLITS